MSLQDKINNIIASASSAKWDQLSQAFIKVTNHDPTIAMNIERDALWKIGDPTRAGSDKKVIRAIAEYEVLNNPDEFSGKKIKLFMLQHRSQFNPGSEGQYLNNSRQICNTSNQLYINRLNAAPVSPQVENPSEETPGYKLTTIGNDSGTAIYNLVEYGQLFGREQPAGFAISISTAACVYNGITDQYIDYSGYFFEGGGSIPNITTSGTTRILNYIIYTPGGGPISENNWIIKVVETATSGFNGDNTYKKYTTNDGRIVKKFYIHFFKPNGTYLRREVDRTTTVKGSTGLNDLDIWLYQDYRSPQAIANNETFASIWNSTYSGNNKIYGAPPKRDFSLFWNTGEPGSLAQQTAKNGSNIWSGKGA